MSMLNINIDVVNSFQNKLQNLELLIIIDQTNLMVHIVLGCYGRKDFYLNHGMNIYV